MAVIGIIGGHGKVAMLAAPLLTEAGEEVVSIIRREEQSEEVAGTGARPVVEDVMELSADQMAELFTREKLDAVVWSAGVGGGDPERTWKVDRDAAIRSMDAAEKAGIKRYVMVSYLGASLNHTVPEDDGFYAYAQSKAEADEHLRRSGLDWTILGPSVLTLDEPTGKVEVTADADGRSTSRGNVARAIQAALADDSTIRKGLPFVDGETPIAEAFAQAPATDQVA